VKKCKREISIGLYSEKLYRIAPIDLENITVENKKRHVVQARQLAMFFAKKSLLKPFGNIGSQIERSDHATVLHQLVKLLII
jgi:chromosomal replication initiator protein